MLEVTAELGGQYCRVLSGQNRPGLVEAEAIGWVVGCLETLVPHAEKTGVTMVMENHYKDGLWEYPEFAQGTRRYRAILDSIDSPWLAAQYDPSNAIVAGDDQYQLLVEVLPRLATMQASDRYLQDGSIEDLRRRAADPEHGYAKFIKHGVIGCGLNDYDRIFSLLAGAGYRGWISVEDGEGATIEEGMNNLRASVQFLRGKIARYLGGAS
jgi:sugar phosphate isomerase/epimerase